MKMKPLFAAVILSGGVLASGSAFADDRKMIDIPPQAQTALLTEMRALVDHMDDLLSALGEGDFKEVAWIADFKLGFGHARWEKMLDSGMTRAQVQAEIDNMKKRRGQGGGHGGGHGGGYGRGGGGGGNIFGQGVGRLMPQEVRQLGQMLHGAAGEVAIAAKKVGEKPTVEDYKAVTSALQQMTSSCRACHTSFKIR